MSFYDTSFTSIGTLEFLFTCVFLKLTMNEKEELGISFTVPLASPESKHCVLLR